MNVTRCWRIPSHNTCSAFTTDFSLSLPEGQIRTGTFAVGTLYASGNPLLNCWSQTLPQWQWFLIDLPQQFCVLFTINLIPWCEEFMLKMCKSWFNPLISFDCFSGDLSQICGQKSRRGCSSEKPQKSNGWKSGWTACLLLLNHRSHWISFPEKKKLFVVVAFKPNKGYGKPRFDC